MSKKTSKQKKAVEKALLAGVGAALSRDTIKKAATTIYNDVHKEVKTLLSKLEKEGKLRTKETQSLLSEIQKKAETEKVKIYRELKKQGKTLSKTAQNIISVPMSLINIEDKSSNHRNSKSKSRSKKKTKKRSKRKKR